MQLHNLTSRNRPDAKAAKPLQVLLTIPWEAYVRKFRACPNLVDKDAQEVRI